MIAISTFFSGLDEKKSRILSDSTKKTTADNATVTYFSKSMTSSGVCNLLVVRSVHGNEFEVPILTPVSNLFPIPDGVIMEVPFSFSASTAQCLQRVHGPSSQSPLQKYLYLCLTFHPLNNYRPLKIRENDSEANNEVD
jgi:hypothetical protein